MLSCEWDNLLSGKTALAKVGENRLRQGNIWAKVLQCVRDNCVLVATQIRSTCPPFKQQRAVLHLGAPRKCSQLLPPHNLSGFFEVRLGVHLTYIATYCPPLSLTEELAGGG